MASRDDELEQLWRVGLAELAPPTIVPDPARVAKRRARIRMRRASTGAAIAVTFVVGASTAVLAAPGGGHGPRVRTNDGPTTASSSSPAPTGSVATVTTRVSGPVESTTTLTPSLPTTIPADPSGTGPDAGLPQPTLAPTGFGGPTTTPRVYPRGTIPESATPTTTSGPPTTDTPTTLPGAGSIAVVVTYDDSGLHASPISAADGELDVTFVDERSTRTGTPTLYLEIHQQLGATFVTGVGGHAHLSLCAHSWFFSVRLNGEASSDVAWRGFNVDSPECTTPVT